MDLNVNYKLKANELQRKKKSGKTLSNQNKDGGQSRL